MVGRRQIDAVVRHLATHLDEIPADRFEYTGRGGSGRIRCVLCGRTGAYGLVGLPDLTTALNERGRVVWYAYRPWSPWQVGCLVDHPWPCSCGLTFPVYVNLWRHIGADRPAGWGRQGEHRPVLSCRLVEAVA